MKLRWLSFVGVLFILIQLPAASADPISRAEGKPPTASKSVRSIFASFLEAQPRFRKYDDDGAPKLVKARIAGPVLGLRASHPKQPVYCVQVDLIMTNRSLATLWATHEPLEAFVTFVLDENGGERIEGQVRSVNNFSSSCHDAPFMPFPELEKARAQRRRALKRADP